MWTNTASHCNTVAAQNPFPYKDEQVLDSLLASPFSTRGEITCFTETVQTPLSRSPGVLSLLTPHCPGQLSAEAWQDTCSLQIEMVQPVPDVNIDYHQRGATQKLRPASSCSDVTSQDGEFSGEAARRRAAKQARKERNRASAERSRMRKKLSHRATHQRLHELESSNQELQGRIALLASHLETLRETGTEEDSQLQDSSLSLTEHSNLLSVLSRGSRGLVWTFIRCMSRMGFVLWQSSELLYYSWQTVVKSWWLSNL